MVAFISAGSVFTEWMDTFDPDSCELSEAADALRNLGSVSSAGFGKPQRPRYRLFKPNEEWQRNLRKVARLRIGGHRSGTLPNDDGVPYTLCSVAYDLCDVYELIVKLDTDHLAQDLAQRAWPYMQHRIRSCEKALRHSDDSVADPFERLLIRGKMIRFVTWRSSAWTHASEDPETIRGATTLCGGREAYHRHTHQQWSCYWCDSCYRILRGEQPGSQHDAIMSLL
jgi:hypothetical protein